MRNAAVAMMLASLVTVPQHDGQRSNLDAPGVSVSGDGRYVALISQDRLVSADTNNRRDVYVLDRASGIVSLESLAPDGTASAEDSDHPALSDDARFLVYESADRVVLRDRADGSTTVLGIGRQPAISGDGRVAAFTAAEGVMVFDRATRATRNISVDTDGRARPDASNTPSLSGDGRYVAFASTAALTSAAVGMRADGAGRPRRPLSQVYVRDLQQGATHLVSVGLGGKPADGDSWNPVISEDGCALAFVSVATNLVKGDRNHSADVFVVNAADLTGDTIELISRNAKGDSGNGPSGRPALSEDGEIIAFQSAASDLTKAGPDINLLWDVFLFNRREGQATRLSGDPENEWMEASGGPAIDASGRVVAFSSRHPIDASDTRNDFDLFVMAGLP